MDFLRQTFDSRATTAMITALLDEDCRLFPVPEGKRFTALTEVPDKDADADGDPFKPRWWPGQTFSLE